MPHCCPQKQQCVFTSRSGSTLVDSRSPVIDDRCGPKRSMMRIGSTGTSATALPCLSLIACLAEAGRQRRAAVQILAPQRALRQSEERPAASGTDLLIVAASCQLVVKPELLFHDYQ